MNGVTGALPSGRVGTSVSGVGEGTDGPTGEWRSPPPPTEPSPYVSPGPPPNRRRSWKTWQLLAATAVSLVLGLTVGAAIGDKESDEGGSAADVRTPAAPSTRVVTTTTAATTPTTQRRTSTTLGGGRTRTDPVPRGEAGALPNGSWIVRVLDVTPNANAVAKERPPQGRQFFMVRVAMTYQGADTDSPRSVELSAVGESNVVYRSRTDSCGVIPDSYADGGRVSRGGTVEGNVCWSVTSADAPGIMMIAEPSFSLGRSPGVYFSLG